MPELQELRDALNHLAGQADGRVVDVARYRSLPTGAGSRADHRRRARRWRMGAPLVVAAAVAAVAIALPAALSGEHATRSSAPSTGATRPTAGHSSGHRSAVPASRLAGGIPRPASGAATVLRLDYALDPVSGVTVAPLEVNRLYQSVEIGIDALRTSRDQSVPRGGELYVFYRGVFRPSSVPHLRSVSVHGHRGWITRAGAPTETQASSSDGQTDGVVWEYAPDSWALLLIDRAAWRAVHEDTAARNVALARAVYAQEQPLRLPFRLTGVPSGLHTEGAMSVVTTAADGQLRGNGSLGLSDGRPRAAGQDYTLGSALQVNVQTRFAAAYCPAATCRAVRVGTRTTYEYRSHGKPIDVSTDVGSTTLTIAVDPAHAGRFSFAELESMLADVDVARSVSDPSTWFDAAQSQH